MLRLIGFSIAVATMLSGFGARADTVPERITFPSADGRTMLTGYLFVPARRGAGRAPAVVMMHGRAGAYSTNANGRYDATTLSQRHAAWGELWAAHGYVALLVDGFGPRGYAQGFPRFSYETRPAELDEVTVRPLDAYGALAYLRGRSDVAPDRIGLQGWSNGGSAALAAMEVDAQRLAGTGAFRAALVFYAGCGLRGHFDAQSYRPYATVLAFHGTADEETSHKLCQRFVERSRALGGDITLKLYPGASHGFDDPGRQKVTANRSASADARASSEALFGRILADQPRR